MLQLPDIITLIKDFGIVAVLSIACGYLAYILVRFVAIKTIKKVLEDHDIAISKINKLLESVTDPKTDKILSRVEVIMICNELLSRFTETAEEMAKRCELETCPHLEHIINLSIVIDKKLNEHIEIENEEIKAIKEKTEKYVGLVLDRINESNKETKDMTHSIISLLKSFVNRAIIEEEKERE